MKEFGFLQHPLKGNFAGISITPLPDHSENLDWLQKNSNKDGYFYPPQIATYSVDPFTNKTKEKIKQSEKPATVYNLPPSHQININNPVAKQSEQFTDEVLIIYLLAYLHGTRLQPSEWKFEGRVPIKSVHNIFISDDTCLHFLEHTYTWWRALTEHQRTKFVNLLYVYTRATSLEWNWDAFVHQYMVFDALYNFHLEFKPRIKASNHKERFSILCSEYTVFNEDYVEKIYDARNNLFHEAMWVGGSTIGYGSPDNNAHQLPHHLARLNARIICSITGYKNEYTSSIWWSMGTFLFNKNN